MIPLSFHFQPGRIEQTLHSEGVEVSKLAVVLGGLQTPQEVAAVEEVGNCWYCITEWAVTNDGGPKMGVPGVTAPPTLRVFPDIEPITGTSATGKSAG